MERIVTAEEAELQKAIERVVSSKGAKKLIVAGPGAGKTTLFKTLLKATSGRSTDHLVLTFINSLKDDLETQLSEYAKVFTLHGYCFGLLHRKEKLREGLSPEFRCQPGLASLIRSDWTHIQQTEAPHFVRQMRELQTTDDLKFYLERSSYYDAVDFDDCVFRAYKALTEGHDEIDSYQLVLIDEYQDFNALEAGFIDLLSKKSPIVIAGDDDQALYSQLRQTSCDHIRSLYRGGDFEVFELPYCMRCPKVIVDAVNDVILEAQKLKKLEGRILKPFKHFALAKGEDSDKYPTIALVLTSVQRDNANYMGRFIAAAIDQIPQEEYEFASKSGYPVALIIAARPYSSQIIDHLNSKGYTIEVKRDTEDMIDREHGLVILKNDPASNLGWRIILEAEKKKFAAQFIMKTAAVDCRLVDLLSKSYGEQILAEAAALKLDADQKNSKSAATRPAIKITSFEGAKGLSAQHVFIAGLHNDEIPRDPGNIQDLEICKFVVGLTRTRKRCYLIHTRRFAQNPKHPSVFISWIADERFERIEVNAKYWLNP
jgi:superfamily I DNA/RNA helicase